MQRYWFKNKKHGIGLTPATWEGWAVTVLYIVGMGWIGMQLSEGVEAVKSVQSYVVSLVGLSILFLGIVTKFGEKIDWKIGGIRKKLSKERKDV